MSGGSKGIRRLQIYEDEGAWRIMHWRFETGDWHHEGPFETVYQATDKAAEVAGKSVGRELAELATIVTIAMMAARALNEEGWSITRSGLGYSTTTKSKPKGEPRNGSESAEARAR